MATPETEEVALEPKIKPEDLREADPAKRAELLEPYQKDLGTMSSWQVDMAMNQAVVDGVFEVDDEGPEDDAFNGREVLAKTPDVQEAQDMLAAMRNQRAKALEQEKFDKIDPAVKAKTDETQQVEALIAEVERAFRTHEIDLQPHVAAKAEVEYREGTVGEKGKPAVKERAAQPATPEIPAGIKALTQKEQAIKAAIDRVWGDFTEDQKTAFGERLAAIASQKAEILKDEGSRRERAGETEKKAAKVREEAARKAIEAATKVKVDQAKEKERILEHGLNQEVLAPGTKVENVHPDMLGHYEKNDDGTEKRDPVTGDRIWIAPKVGADGKLIVEMKVTSQSVVDEATKINEEHDLIRQFGREGAVKEAERRAQQKQMEEARPGPNAAHEQANAINETFNHYKRLIDLEPNETIRAQLVDARKAAMETERTRQEGLTEAVARRRADAVAVAEGARLRSAAKEHSAVTLNGDDPDAEEIAIERRVAGNFDPVPILEVKKGGIFARDKYRGPKIIENTYRSLDANNENVLMIERRNRRTGKLISQSIVTTEKPLRRRMTRTGEVVLPPREIHKDLDKIRAEDQARLRTESGSQWGSKSFRDFVTPGFGTGGAISGENGIYAENVRRLSTDPDDARRIGAANRLNDFKASGRKRRGSWLYWVSDQNI